MTESLRKDEKRIEKGIKKIKKDGRRTKNSKSKKDYK